MSEQQPAATPANGATLLWRITQLERQVDDLNGKLDRLILWVAGGALSVAVSAVVLTLTVFAGGR